MSNTPVFRLICAISLMFLCSCLHNETESAVSLFVYTEPKVAFCYNNSSLGLCFAATTV
jgi:hypothetical protein